MKKYSLTSLLLVSTLFGQDINLQNGWQLKGTETGFVSMENFDKECIKTVWKFDGQWKAYSPDETMKQLLENNSIPPLTMINVNDGFWVYSNGNCNVTTNGTTPIEFPYSTVINYAVSVIESIDIENDNYADKIAEVKSILNVPQTDSAYHQDIEVANAVVDLLEIANMPVINELVNINLSTYADNLPNFLKITNLGEDLIIIKQNADFSENISEILLEIADKLIAISNSLNKSFSSVDYCFEYGPKPMDYTQAQALRSAILLSASKIKFVSSYNFGEDNYYNTNTQTLSIAKDDPAEGSLSLNVEYIEAESNPVALLNSSTFFTLKSTNNFAEAKELLIKALSIITTKIDVTKVQFSDEDDEEQTYYGYYEPNQEDDEDEDKKIATEIQIEAFKMLNSINNNSIYQFVSEDDLKVYIDINALYDENNPLDKNSFGDLAYNNKLEREWGEDINCTYDPDMSKILNEPICWPDDDMYAYNTKEQIVTNPNWYYWGGYGIDYEPISIPQVSTSRIDDIIIKIVEDGAEYTGQNLLNKLFQ